MIYDNFIELFIIAHMLRDKTDLSRYALVVYIIEWSRLGVCFISLYIE